MKRFNNNNNNAKGVWGAPRPDNYLPTRFGGRNNSGGRRESGGFHRSPLDDGEFESRTMEDPRHDDHTNNKLDRLRRNLTNLICGGRKRISNLTIWSRNSRVDLSRRQDLRIGSMRSIVGGRRERRVFKRETLIMVFVRGGLAVGMAGNNRKTNTQETNSEALVTRLTNPHHVGIPPNDTNPTFRDTRNCIV